MVSWRRSLEARSLSSSPARLAPRRGWRRGCEGAPRVGLMGVDGLPVSSPAHVALRLQLRHTLMRRRALEGPRRPLFAESRGQRVHPCRQRGRLLRELLALLLQGGSELVVVFLQRLRLLRSLGGGRAHFFAGGPMRGLLFLQARKSFSQTFLVLHATLLLGALDDVVFPRRQLLLVFAPQRFARCKSRSLAATTSTACCAMHYPSVTALLLRPSNSEGV